MELWPQNTQKSVILAPGTRRKHTPVSSWQPTKVFRASQWLWLHTSQLPWQLEAHWTFIGDVITQKVPKRRQNTQKKRFLVPGTRRKHTPVSSWQPTKVFRASEWLWLHTSWLSCQLEAHWAFIGHVIAQKVPKNARKHCFWPFSGHFLATYIYFSA